MIIISPYILDLFVFLNFNIMFFKKNWRSVNTLVLFVFSSYNCFFFNFQVTEFLNEMLTNAKQFNMTLLPVFTKNIPPSSLHSFRRILKNETESGQLPQVLLVDYKDTFTNAYYESIFDDADNIGFVYRNISVGPDGLCE